MALGFFRRNQKMVMIIMVLLMVSFLIGFQGFTGFFRSQVGKHVLGKTSFGDVRQDDKFLAASDLRILGYLPLADPQAKAPTAQEFAALARMPEDERTLCYALLLQEAQHNGTRVGEDDVDQFLASIQYVEDNYTRFLAALHNNLKVGESQFRDALKRWLTIHKMFATSLVATPPSEREVSFLCRDFFEKIELRILRFPADKFLDKVEKTLDPNAVQQQFAQFRNSAPGQFTDENPFGFGYYQLNRVQVVYAYVSKEVVERAARPSSEQVDKYYADPANRDELLKPASQPAAASGAAPSAGAKGLMTPDEARPVIIQTLTAKNVTAKMDELAAQFRAALADVPSSTSPVSVYQVAWSHMLLPKEANAALDKSMDAAAYGSMRLDAAMDKLAADAGLKAIVFPWGAHGEKTLSPDVQVKLEGKMTLREALKKVCEQVQWSPIEWGMCASFEGVLFPLAGEGAADFFPIVVRQTGLLTPEELQKDPILGNTITQPPMRANVAILAFTSQPFAQARRVGEPMKEGQDGPAMTVWGPQGGTVFWRLLKAVPGAAPQQMNDEIRRQVEKDLRIRKAMDLAYQEAEGIRTEAQFAAADANGEANAISTGSFSRRTPPSGEWTSLPELGLPPARNIQKAFIDAAFALMPGATEGASIGLVRMPSLRQVLVMRRVGAKPIVRDEYQKSYRPQLVMWLLQQSESLSFQVWFTPESIRQRVAYVPEVQPSKPTEAEPDAE